MDDPTRSRMRCKRRFYWANSARRLYQPRVPSSQPWENLSRPVRVEAAAALAKIDPESAVPLGVLMLALESTDLELLEPAISAIARLGPRAAEAAPKLKKILARNDLYSRNVCWFAT